MDERDRESDSRSSWLPPVDLGEESSAESGRPTHELRQEAGDKRSKSRRAALGWSALGLAVTATVTVSLLASGGEAVSGDPEGSSSVSNPPSRATPIVGTVGPGKALRLAAAIQVKDRQADDSAGITETEAGGPLGPTTTTAVRARYIVRLAAAAALLRDIGNRASRFRGSGADGSREANIRQGLSELTAVSTGLDTSIYVRSRELDGLVNSTVAQVADALDSGDEDRVQELGDELSRLGGEITTQLERAADAAGEGRDQRAGRVFELVERRLAMLDRTVNRSRRS